MPDPSVTASLRNLRFNDRPFSSAMWDEESRAMLVVNEFSKMSWADLHLDPYPTAATVDAEITDLFSRMSERAELLPEILDQMTTLVPSFTAALGISRVSHPATHLVITTCEKISAFVAPYFKSTAPRPRPSQIAPALHPPVPLPGTPSYPQQHGLSAYLIANSLGNLLPAAAAKPLTELAFNFADNRVVAGLSYPSDVAAAKEIAGAVFPLLQACASFNAVMQRAKMEWGGVTATELPDTQATAITTATQFDLDSTLRRFEAAGERMLLVFEPVPDRTLTAADLAVGLQFLSDLQRHATAIVSAASVLASQPALSAREAYDQALGGPPTDALSELELLDMGTGTPAWIEALVKTKPREPLRLDWALR